MAIKELKAQDLLETIEGGEPEALRNLMRDSLTGYSANRTLTMHFFRRLRDALPVEAVAPSLLALR